MTTGEQTHGEGERTIITRPATTNDLDEVRALMIRTFEEDFGYGYNPAFHADVDDLRGTYLDNPRHTLFVAVEPGTGRILGTAGIRSGGLKPAFNEPWLVARYDPERTAQIVRVYTLREARGRGVARALVGRVTAFAATAEGYDVIALHTDPRSPGAERFWRSMPTTLIYDDRDGPSGSLHFEMGMPGRATPTEVEGAEGRWRHDLATARPPAGGSTRA